MHIFCLRKGQSHATRRHCLPLSAQASLCGSPVTNVACNYEVCASNPDLGTVTRLHELCDLFLDGCGRFFVYRQFLRHHHEASAENDQPWSYSASCRAYTKGMLQQLFKGGVQADAGHRV